MELISEGLDNSMGLLFKVYLIFCFAVSFIQLVLIVVGMMGMFKKMNVNPWKALIPCYGFYYLLTQCWGKKQAIAGFVFNILFVLATIGLGFVAANFIKVGFGILEEFFANFETIYADPEGFDYSIFAGMTGEVLGESIIFLIYFYLVYFPICVLYLVWEINLYFRLPKVFKMSAAYGVLFLFFAPIMYMVFGLANGIEFAGPVKVKAKK